MIQRRRDISGGVGIKLKQGLSRKYLSPCVFVVLEGLEPSLAEPESDVLPLHHKTIFKSEIESSAVPSVPGTLALRRSLSPLISGAKLEVFCLPSKFFRDFF